MLKWYEYIIMDIHQIKFLLDWKDSKSEIAYVIPHKIPAK